jgi:hypothetical protein
MKWNACLLIVLTFWAQLDDALIISGCDSPTDSLASNDDDECLSSEHKEQQNQFRAQREPYVFALKPLNRDFPALRSGVSLERNLTAPFTPPSLYVFMSMQI